MSDDLVKRLRGGLDIGEEAADCIEELEKQNASLEAKLSEAEKGRDTYFAERNQLQLYLQRTHADLEIEAAAVDGLNVKLAEAVVERDEWQSLAEAAVKDDATKNIYYAEIQYKAADCVAKTLDAANEYMTVQYGILALGNPIDRSRIIAKIKGEQP